MKDFLVFVATVRPRAMTAPTLARLQETFTMKSDLIVVDGSDGKSRNQDRVIEKLMGDYEFFASFDDDVLVAAAGWQETIVQAFKDVIGLGCAGIDYVDDEGHHAYMAEVNTPLLIGSTTVRLQRQQNLGGACMIFPREVIQKIGPVKHIEGVTHEYFEDGYRCHCLGKLGLRWGYVQCPGSGLRMLNYPDDPAFIARKDQDIARSREVGLHWD